LLIQVIQYGYQERAYLVVFLRNNFDEEKGVYDGMMDTLTTIKFHVCCLVICVNNKDSFILCVSVCSQAATKWCSYRNTFDG